MYADPGLVEGYTQALNAEGVRLLNFWRRADNNKSQYLKALHPEQHREYIKQLRAIRQIAAQHLEQLDTELASAGD